MSLSSSEQQRLAIIEAGLAGERRLVELAGCLGQPGGLWRRRVILGLTWVGFPVAVGCTAGLGVALILDVKIAIYGLAALLAVLWPLTGYALWRRWHRWGLLF